MFETNRETILSLQAGRAAAAMAVVIAHAASSTIDFVAPFPSPLGDILEHGWLGVDFFFVLSGFIIYHTTLGKEQTLAGARSYAWSRLTRIFIPFLPISIVLMLAYGLLPGAGGANRDWSVLASLTLLPIGDPALTVAWTLQHELVFYAIFALGFFTGRLPLVMGIWALAIVVDLGWGIDHGFPLKIVLNPINLEFLFGIACEILVFRKFRSDTWIYVSVAIVSFAIWALLDFSRSYSAVAGFGIAALIVPVVRLELDGRITIPRWAVFLGAASYALYLIHNPLVSVTARIATRVPFLDSLYIATLFGVAASLIAGCLYHLWIEKPASRYVRRRTRPAKLPANEFEDPIPAPIVEHN